MRCTVAFFEPIRQASVPLSISGRFGMGRKEKHLICVAPMNAQKALPTFGKGFYAWRNLLSWHAKYNTSHPHGLLAPFLWFVRFFYFAIRPYGSYFAPYRVFTPR